METIK